MLSAFAPSIVNSLQRGFDMDVFTPDQIKQLEAPLNAKHVAERKQAGRSLSYIEGWHAIAEANRIFGFGNWTRETIDIRCVAEAPKTFSSGKTGHSVSYVCRVRVTVFGVLREGTGAGHGMDADLGLAHESAIKEAETDAMKRALMTFGNPFGLALYDKSRENVDNGQSNSAASPRQNAGAVAHHAAPASSTLELPNTCPENINADLWATALSRAEGGTNSYRSFWQHDTTEAERNALKAYHEAFKARAGLRKDAA
jgi:DNA repair and recombination protein RAD52